MNIKKPIKYLLFLFPLFIGFMPFLIKCNTKKSTKDYRSNNDSQSLNKYKGSWVASDSSSTLEIRNTEAVLTTEKPFLLTFKELTESQLFFQDQFGYDVIIEDKSHHSITLFDEAEQKELVFYKENTSMTDDVIIEKGAHPL